MELPHPCIWAAYNKSGEWSPPGVICGQYHTVCGCHALTVDLFLKFQTISLFLLQSI